MADAQPISFFVPGIAAPGGSKRASLIPKRGSGFVTGPNGRPIIGVRDDCERNKDWRATVALAAREHYRGELLRGALMVIFEFVSPRPKGHFGKRGLKPSAPQYPTKKPDVLKLARAAEDALKGILWVDDSQTVKLAASKDYGEPAGCKITVYPIEGTELAGTQKALNFSGTAEASNGN